MIVLRTFTGCRDDSCVRLITAMSQVRTLTCTMASSWWPTHPPLASHRRQCAESQRFAADRRQRLGGTVMLVRSGRRFAVAIGGRGCPRATEFCRPVPVRLPRFRRSAGTRRRLGARTPDSGNESHRVEVPSCTPRCWSRRNRAGVVPTSERKAREKADSDW